MGIRIRENDGERLEIVNFDAYVSEQCDFGMLAMAEIMADWRAPCSPTLVSAEAEELRPVRNL